MKKWVPLTVHEYESYLALRILMGILRFPSIRDYWSTEYNSGHPAFPGTMSRDRFEDISHKLHFEDSGVDRDENDRLWRLRAFVDDLNYQCQTVYVPAREVSVDESLWKYRGRLAFRQFNPSKRARYGVKVYKLSESLGPAAGYTSGFKVYTGQDKTQSKTLNISMNVVTDLMEKSLLLDKGYIVSVDNWYSSPEL